MPSPQRAAGALAQASAAAASSTFFTNRRNLTLTLSFQIKHIQFITVPSTMTPFAAGMGCGQAALGRRGFRTGQAQHPPHPCSAAAHNAHRAQASTPPLMAVHQFHHQASLSVLICVLPMTRGLTGAEASPTLCRRYENMIPTHPVLTHPS